MPFNNESDLIAGMRNGEWLQYDKGSLTAEAAGTWQSLWKAAGGPAADEFLVAGGFGVAAVFVQMALQTAFHCA